MGRYRTVTDLASFCRHIGGLNLRRTEGEEFADLPDVVDLAGPRIAPAVYADQLTVAVLRAAVRKLVNDGVPPHSPVRYPTAYRDKSGDSVFIKAGADPQGMTPCMWHEPPPEAAAMGPYYSLHLPAHVLKSLSSDPEFAAAAAAGELAIVSDKQETYVIMRATLPDAHA
jgi:hypothetical protein